MNAGDNTPSLYHWLREKPRRFDVAVTIAASIFTVVLYSGSPEDVEAGWPEMAAGIGSIVLLLFRRSKPLALLTISLVTTVGLIVIFDRPAATFFPTFVLLGTTAMRTNRRTSIILGIIVGGALYAAALSATGLPFADPRVLIVAVWSMGVVGIADATRNWRSYRASTEAELASTILASQAHAKRQVSEERLNIARELHDLLAHNLSVMNVQNGAALHLLRSDTDQAETALLAARDAGRGVLDELGDLLAVLRDDGNGAEPTSSLPGIEQIGELIDTMRSNGLLVSWTESGSMVELSPGVSLTAYRTVQEGLTNASKHGTGPVDLETRWSEDGLSIRIENVVGGIAAVGSGLGLVGMRERVAVNGGYVNAGPDGNSFVVEAWLPATTAFISPEER